MEFLMQPMNRALLEEVNDNDGSMELMRFPASAAPGIDVPPVVVSSADGQISPEGEAAEAGSAENTQCSEQSIEQLDPKTPGWTQRVRVGTAAPGRAPCADRITAFEKTVRQFAEDPGDIVIVPKIGTSFDTLGEQFIFLGKRLYHSIWKEPAKCQPDEVHAGDSLWMCGEANCGEHAVLSLSVPCTSKAVAFKG